MKEQLDPLDFTLSLAEFARRVGVSRDTILRMRKSGRIEMPLLHLNNRYRLREEDVDTVIQSLLKPVE